MTLFTRRVSRCRILNPYHPHLANELSALADTKRCEEAVESQRQPAPRPVCRLGAEISSTGASTVCDSAVSIFTFADVMLINRLRFGPES